MGGTYTFDRANAEAYPEFRDGTEVCATADDPDIFYAHGVDLEEPAKRLCRRCTLREKCLEWALATDQRFGIWGAANYRERQTIKRRGPR